MELEARDRAVVTQLVKVLAYAPFSIGQPFVFSILFGGFGTRF